MARKHVGMIDTDLLGRVDAKAAELGQTRRVYVERALALVLAEYGFEDVVTDDRMPPGGFAVVNDKDAVYVPPAAAKVTSPVARRGSPSPSLSRFAGSRPKGKP